MPLNKKKLSNKDLEEVHAWLTKQNINPAKVRREFSDVLPLAELLKPTYPKLIDLYNYPRKNGIQLKFNNWQTFNTKVLSKLGFLMTRELMELLASGEPGAIEVLLNELIKVERKTRRAELMAAEAKQEQVWLENDEVKTIVINKQIGDGIVQMPQKMILYSLYEKLQRECVVKDNLIDSSQVKIEHMANVINLKSQRIEELLTQIGKMSMKTQMIDAGTDNAPAAACEPGPNVQCTLRSTSLPPSLANMNAAAAAAAVGLDGTNGASPPPPTESPNVSNDSIEILPTSVYIKTGYDKAAGCKKLS